MSGSCRSCAAAICSRLGWVRTQNQAAPARAFGSSLPARRSGASDAAIQLFSFTRVLIRSKNLPAHEVFPDKHLMNSDMELNPSLHVAPAKFSALTLPPAPVSP